MSGDRDPAAPDCVQFVFDVIGRNGALSGAVARDSLCSEMDVGFTFSPRAGALVIKQRPGHLDVVGDDGQDMRLLVALLPRVE